MFVLYRSFPAALPLGLATLLVAVEAVAEPGAAATSPDRVTSQVLFERGKALFIEGRYVEACPMFEESQRLLPGIGVLLHLGACFEKSGKTASAWAAFQEAADRAKAEGDSERETMARSRAQALRERRSYLTLAVRTPGSTEPIAAQNAPTDLVILRDGQRIPLSTLGMELPLDPGKHSITLQSSNLAGAQRQIQLAEGEKQRVEIDLVALATPPPTPKNTIPIAAPTTQVKLSFKPPPPRADTTRRWITWSALGLGTAGVLVGSAAGLVAYSRMQSARDLCAGHAKNDCPDESLRLQEQAKFPAKVATVGLAAGVSTLALAGGYWYLSRSERTVVTGAVAPGIAHVAIATRW